VSKALVKPAARAYTDEEWKLMSDPDVIAAVDILDIKWKELYDKWGKYIPQEKKVEWRYYSQDPGPSRRSLVKKHTKESKSTRRTRTRTTDDGVKPKPKKPKDDSPNEDKQQSGII
jgi:hypothetical protein